MTLRERIAILCVGRARVLSQREAELEAKRKRDEAAFVRHCRAKREA